MLNHGAGRRRVSVMIAGLVGLMVLSGCAGGNPESPGSEAVSTADTSESTVSATPIPAVETSAAPLPGPSSVNLDSPQSWLIDFTSVGPLTVGDEVDSVPASMTAFTSTVYDGCPSVTAFARAGSPTVVIPDRLGTGIVEQIVLQGGADPSAIAAGSPRTAEGIGIGSTLEEMVVAYPAITFQDDHYTPHYALPDGAGNWINFSLVDDVVRVVVVRASPDVAKEYCS